METSPTATWFQSEEAYNCFQSCCQWLEPFLVQVHRKKRLVGSVLGYVTKERCTVKQFFTARAVIFGGPLLAEDISETELATLLKQVESECEKWKVIYTEIRNFRDFSWWRGTFEKAGWTYVPHYDIHIDTSNRQKMIARIHESKLRAIRKAQEQGEELVEATTEDQFIMWYKQLRRLYRTKVHRPLWPVDFFLTAWRNGYAKLLMLETGDKVEDASLPVRERCAVGGMFCVQDETTLYEWYICGQAMVTFGALEYANKQGLERFDLMGAGEPGVPYGVRDFKMQFGGELKELGRFQLIHKPWLYKLGTLLLTLNSTL